MRTARDQPPAWSGRFTCDEAVDGYLGGEKIACLICDQAFPALARHLGPKHNLSADAYRGRFGIPQDRPLISRAVRERRSRSLRAAFQAGPIVGHDANAWTGRFESTEEVEVYLGGSDLECLLCRERGFESLNRHIKRRHGCTATVYKDRFGIPRAESLLSPALRKKCSDFALANPNDYWAERKEKAAKRRSEIDWTVALARIDEGKLLIRDICNGRDGMPTVMEWRERRQKDLAFRQLAKESTRNRRRALIDAETIDRVVAGLEAGLSVNKVVRTLPRILTPGAIVNLRVRDPAFAGRVRHLWRPDLRLAPERRIERERLREQQRQEQRFAPHRHTEEFRAALRSDEVYAAVHAAAQRLPPDMRDDVISDLIVAVLDGEITIADLPNEVGRFRAAHSKMFGIWTPSLDADLGCGFTLGNSLAAAYI